MVELRDEEDGRVALIMNQDELPFALEALMRAGYALAPPSEAAGQTEEESDDFDELDEDEPEEEPEEPSAEGDDDDRSEEALEDESLDDLEDEPEEEVEDEPEEEPRPARGRSRKARGG